MRAVFLVAHGPTATRKSVQDAFEKDHIGVRYLRGYICIGSGNLDASPERSSGGGERERESSWDGSADQSDLIAADNTPEQLEGVQN